MTTNTNAASWLLRDHPEMQELMCRQFDTLHDLMEAQALERFELQKRLVREIQGQRNEPITVDMETAPRVLPPIIPLRDGIRVTAPSMQCPLCKAKPGKPCVKISSRGLPGVEMGEPLAGGSYHTARLQRAKEASS